jgi:hypothetical protein
VTVACYGRTYLDAEVELAIASLASGKGKLDAPVTAVVGGFASNAARALADRLPASALHVVTVASWLDWPRVRASLPGTVELDAIIVDSLAWPPISVIVNPAGECRLLRGRGDEDAASWRLDRVASGARGADLHLLGRLPDPFVRDLLAASRGTGARVAWVGGDAIAPELEVAFALMCVNTAEAMRLVGAGEASPRELARELAARASVDDAVRVVTGRGSAPTAAAVRTARDIVLHESTPAPIPRGAARRLKGAGDLFAARFVVDACCDERGARRDVLHVATALASAQAAAARFILGEPGT